ncbi:hypothetical protein NC652_001391 [Populus alba x Populus x berolinensis]|uniref:Uncharacterized protein n=1 Tax=Populus alba x Populus x berolinensis TaxID=444605 RepID=A0AAD6RLB3_9ROSI|nr:hypothetical protein NC652_001391 [Populus alba x Populus x berolinensis]KAJ7010969.1 hypothetical protein NC653_001419 [Populus alba x Populus x berolinensis]
MMERVRRSQQGNPLGEDPKGAVNQLMKWPNQW